MTELEIKYKILHAKGLKDFIEIIDLIGAEDLGENYHPMSISQWYSLVNLSKYPKYNTFTIPKKSGGTRLISTPKFPSYLLALKYTNKILQCFYEPPVCTMGFVAGKSYFKEMYISEVSKKWNIDLSAVSNQGKAEKRWDFVVKTDSCAYLIETNFYGSGGSKLNETARSYKTIATEMKNVKGAKFVWFTDGAGWKSAARNLEETFDVLDDIYSINDMQNGIMKEIFI